MAKKWDYYHVDCGHFPVQIKLCFSNEDFQRILRDHDILLKATALDEGIAEYFELPQSSQGRHEQHLAHLAGRLIEGTWRPDMARMESLAAAGEMSQDHYAESWCWVHWLLASPERRAVLQDYLADLRRDPATPPLSVRLRQTIG